MADNQKDKPDASSIKPVSSLLSHFESISSKRPPPPQQPAAPKPAYAPLLDQERARSSLDLPRRPSPWNTAPDSVTANNGGDSGTSSRPIARQLPPGAASRQRPLSSGPWSPPRSPPTLRVQSPASPPKSVFYTPPQPSLNRQPTPEAFRLDFSRPPSVPHPPNSRMLSEPPDKLSLLPSQSARTSPIPTKRAPPPINRASKPSTPTAPTFNFDPGKNGSLERISPFSTPPSDDENPSKGQPMQTGQQPATPTYGQGSYFPPPPVHRDVEARRYAASEQANLRKNPAVSSAPKPSTRTRQDTSDLPHERPTLPNRPEARGSPPRQRRAESEHADGSRLPHASKPPPRPSEASKYGAKPPEFLPPPKRNLIPSSQGPAPASEKLKLTRSVTESEAIPVQRSMPLHTRVDPPADPEGSAPAANQAASDYPDASQTNRRPPKSMCGVHRIWTEYDTKVFDLRGNCVCSGGYVTRAWDTKNARKTMDLAHPEREVKVTALVFKPGKSAEEEGLYVWLGNNMGEIHEVDLRTQNIVETKSNAHGRREIVKMHRHQNNVWSLDEEGKFHVWAADEDGTPNLRLVPLMYRVSRGHTYSIVARNLFWLATGKEIRIYNPSAGEQGFDVTLQPLSQPATGEITSGAVISNQLDRVYFGHNDGKVSIYSTKDFSCLGVFNTSSYKINCLAGAGVYLWAGYNTGMIYVYDTQQRPWRVVKEWQAHASPVLSFVVDRSSLWKFGHLQLASLGADNAICFWDGMLEDDWIENDMQQHDIDYCAFNEIRTVVMTWNAGASTPYDLRHDEKSVGTFRSIIQTDTPPDVLVFGFQELVDLEDKKLTAKSFFKGSKKKDPGEAEHMSHQYRAWRDFLMQLLDDSMPSSETYHLLHTASLVGLFSCVFVKASLRPRVRKVGVAEVKRGLGGLHGNKGSITVRFLVDDSSLCFTNCHLAAGQSQTVNRNNDVTAILESAGLPAEPDPDSRIDSFAGGGDGSMIMDHEICVLNGDLNYRIDTMGRDTVVKAVNSNNFGKLLERDQLLVSRRRNPGFRLRSFHEQEIRFAPTYKYDVGTDRYDTSEKNRSPAWCDRVLYRGPGRIKQIEYKRHELRLSDHRPVSGTFLMRLKTIDPKRRAIAWEQSEERLLEMRQSLAKEIKLEYLITVMGIGEKEARKLLEK